MDEQSYKIDDWQDVEHCAYHAMTDDPPHLTDHRIAHVVAGLAAALVEHKIMTVEQLEQILATCRS